VKQLLVFDLCTLVFVVLQSLIQAAEEVQRPKYKDLRPRDLRESNSDAVFTLASSRKREFVA
jgi:hypothetical protein